MTFCLIQDQETWNALLASVGRHDFHHTWHFHALAQTGGEGVPCMVHFTAAAGGVVWPLLRRDIPGTDLQDLTSVYGYPSPLTYGTLTSNDLERFRRNLPEFLAGRGFVSLFSRLHPILSHPGLLDGLSLTSGTVVAIDLHLPEPEQLAHYRSGHVKDLKRMRKLGLTCLVSNDDRQLDAFQENYLGTMHRLGAHPRYCFSRAYVEAFLRSSAYDAKIYSCVHQGQIIASAIFVFCGDICQYFLSGSSESFRNLSGAKLLIDQARQDAHARGCSTLILGGGIAGQQDDLFRFKQGFSSLVLDFSVVKMVVNPRRYDQLSSTDSSVGDFFPRYRIGESVTAQRKLIILLSSAGRRTALLHCFRNDATKLGISLTIVATDVVPEWSPACHEADLRRAVPRCNDPGFIPAMLALVTELGVKLIVPTIDHELLVFSEHIRDFERLGCRIALGSPDAVAIARDKLATAQTLERRGIAVPRTTRWNPASSRMAAPVILKPAYGSSSQGLFFVDDWSNFQPPANLSDYILQQRLSGIEYTVNCFTDQQGHLVIAIPHRRIEVRGGEVSKAETVRHPLLEETAKRIMEAIPGLRGPWCFQAIDSGDSCGVFEINSRFGGGFPVTHRAGGHFTEWLMCEALGLPIPVAPSWSAGIRMLRYDAAVFTDRS